MRGIKQEQLDFLRGVAATYVAVNHVRGAFFIGSQKLIASDPSPANYLAVAFLQLTTLGAELVILFFVLSGFAMAHSVKHSKSTGTFYLKRFVRIWPPYAAACLFAFFVGAVVGVEVPLMPMLFYLKSSPELTHPFWSLSYEVVFYAMCPLILANSRRVAMLGWTALGLTAATLIVRGVGFNPWHFFPLDFLGNELLFFAVGALTYHHLDRVPVLSGRALLWACAALSGMVWLSKAWIGDTSFFSNMMIVGMGALLIRNLPDRVAAFAPTNWGFFSYSIYIYHFALIVLLAWALAQFGVDASRIANPFGWVLAVPLVLGGCFLLYLVTERVSNEWVKALRRGPGDAAFAINPNLKRAWRWLVKTLAFTPSECHGCGIRLSDGGTECDECWSERNW